MEAARTTVTAVPVSTLDPFSPEVLTDPLVFYQELREAGPVVYLERYDIWSNDQNLWMALGEVA